jgi:UDP-2,3-diacylglucosamine hydrolase
VLLTTHYDFFVFGHRHLPLDIPLNQNSRYVNLGEWVHHQTYAEWNEQGLFLHTFKNA